VALRDDLELCSAQLYRFACALVCGHPGPCAQVADLVRATLSAALEGSPASRLTGDNLRIRLYAVLIEWHRDGRAVGSIGAKARVEIDNFHIAKRSIGGNASVIASSQDNFSAALLDLGLDEREALLLVALEGFDYGQAARILKISRSALVGRLARARAALSETVPVESSGRPVKARPTYLRLVK
jgi:RNA polymerase sigma-70 factor (ECF subfamily)